MRFLGLMAIIPVTIFLTVSYFVMVLNEKNDKKSLKTFGLVVCILLWITAGLITVGGIVTLATGRHPIMIAMEGCCKQGMHKCMMMAGKQHCMMMDKGMKGEMQGDRKCMKGKEAGEVKK